MTDEFDWIDRAGTKAKGKRPEFFENPAVDRLLSLSMALAAELSAVRERQDTVERLLDEKGILNREEIEGYHPTHEVGIERGVETRAYISRIMRGFQQEVEAMEANDDTLEEAISKLAKE